MRRELDLKEKPDRLTTNLRPEIIIFGWINTTVSIACIGLVCVCFFFCWASSLVCEAGTAISTFWIGELTLGDDELLSSLGFLSVGEELHPLLCAGARARAKDIV